MKVPPIDVSLSVLCVALFYRKGCNGNAMFSIGVVSYLFKLRYLLGLRSMVHEQDELDSHSRKRPYPFIHWIQTQSPEPDSKRSPEPESESYKPPLPSPPLLSSKYRSFKSGLDTFGARPGQTENNENAQFDSGKEKVKVYNICWLRPQTTTTVEILFLC